MGNCCELEPHVGRGALGLENNQFLRSKEATESIYCKQDILIVVRCFNIDVEEDKRSEFLCKIIKDGD